MNVDRARFLLLTTALSAATAVAVSSSGCTVKNSDNSSGGTYTPPADNDAATGTDSGADAYTGDSSYEDGGSCLGDDGVAPTCEGMDAVCNSICQKYVTNYKKGVARSIETCLLALPTCEGADTMISNCVQVALGMACADPSAATFCTPLVNQCSADASGGSLDQTECQDLATGLSEAGRVEFTNCVTEGQAGYCGATPSACLDSIE